MGPWYGRPGSPCSTSERHFASGSVPQSVLSVQGSVRSLRVATPPAPGDMTANRGSSSSTSGSSDASQQRQQQQQRWRCECQLHDSVHSEPRSSSGALCRGSSHRRIRRHADSVQAGPQPHPRESCLRFSDEMARQQSSGFGSPGRQPEQPVRHAAARSDPLNYCHLCCLLITSPIEVTSKQAKFHARPLTARACTGRLEWQ